MEREYEYDSEEGYICFDPVDGLIEATVNLPEMEFMIDGAVTEDPNGWTMQTALVNIDRRVGSEVDMGIPIAKLQAYDEVIRILDKQVGGLLSTMVKKAAETGEMPRIAHSVYLLKDSLYTKVKSFKS